MGYPDPPQHPAFIPLVLKLIFWGSWQHEEVGGAGSKRVLAEVCLAQAVIRGKSPAASDLFPNFRTGVLPRKIGSSLFLLLLSNCHLQVRY